MRVIFTLFISCLIGVIIPGDYAVAQRNFDITKFNKSDSTQGLLIYSISTMKQAYSSYYLEIYHFESRKKEKLMLMPLHSSPEMKNDSVKVYYQAAMLPSGDYKIYGWGMTYNNGSGITYFPMGNFDLPFTVSGGRINYLGDYLGITSKGRNAIGMKVPSGGYFIVSNRFEKDHPAIVEKWPGLDLNSVLNAMPDFSENKPSRSLMLLKGINIP